MADVQILRAPTTGVPSNYVLPDAAELLLKMVYAEFDGSGAGGSWCPCVTLLSDSGDVLGRAVDVANPVAAGASADVTFFPRLKAGAAAAAAGAFPFLILQGTTTLIPHVPIGLSDHARFATPPEWTNDVSQWTFTRDGANLIYEIHVAGPGLYYIACNFEWEATAAVRTRQTVLNTITNANLTFNDPNFFGTSPFWRDTDTALTAGMLEAWIPLRASGGYFTVEPSIDAGVDVSFTPDFLYMVKLPLSPA